MTNQASNTARNDPTSLDTVLKTYEMGVDGLVSAPGLKASEAGKIKFRLMQHGNEESSSRLRLDISKRPARYRIGPVGGIFQIHYAGELKQFQIAAAIISGLMTASPRRRLRPEAEPRGTSSTGT